MAQSLVNQSFEPFHTDETPGTRTRDNLIKSQYFKVPLSLVNTDFLLITLDIY